MKKVFVPDDTWLCTRCGNLFDLTVKFLLAGSKRKPRKVCMGCVKKAIRGVLDSATKIYRVEPQ